MFSVFFDIAKEDSANSRKDSYVTRRAAGKCRYGGHIRVVILGPITIFISFRLTNSIEKGNRRN